jgi:TP901 family phage tail tape measure protein
MATKIADLYVKLGADTDELDKSLKEASGKLGDIGAVGKKFESVGKDLSLYVTAPLVAIGAIAIKSASDIEKGIGEVVTLFGRTGDEAAKTSKELSKGVAGLSNEFGIAQDVLVNGLYNAISAGVPEDNVFDFMAVATKASVAGVTDVNTAVDGITTGLNAFGLKADEAGRVADSMFAAVKGGKTTFGELSDAMFNVAPAAAAAGVSMEEVNAGIATLTASGVPTSVATTQLRAALQGLNRPSEDLNAIFQSLGYESAQVAIETEGLGFALDAVKDASGGSAGKLQELLGSSEAVSAANIIAGTSAAKFAEEMERQANAAGSVDEAFSVMAETTAFQMDKAKTMLTNVGIAIGNVLLPMFNKLLDSLQGGLAWFSGLSDSTKEIITYVGLFAASLGPLLVIVGKVMAAISSMGAIMTTIQVALAGISAPVLIAVGAFAAFAALGVTIYKNWEPITDWFGNKFPKASEAFAKIWDSLKSSINNAINTIRPAIDKIIDAFSSLFASDGDVVTEVSAFDGAITFFLENIRRTVSGIVDVVGNVIAMVANGIAGWVNTIRSAFNVISSLLRGDFSGAWNGFKDMLSGIWDTVVTNILLAVDSILAAVSGLFGWIPGAEQAITGFREKMKDMIPKEPIQASGKAVESTVKDIDTTSKATTSTVKELGATSVEAASSMATGFAAAGEKVKSMAETIKEIFKTLGEETAAGKRELAFILRLDRETELKNEISALEKALKDLANETTININDSRVQQLQYSLGMARQELEGLAEFKAFEDKLQPKFEELAKNIDNITIKEISEMRKALTKMDVPESGKPLFDELQKRLTAVEGVITSSAEEMQKLEDAFWIEEEALAAWQFFEDELYLIDKTLTGQDNLKAKIDATAKAMADGRIPADAGAKAIEAYNTELKEMNTGFQGLINKLPDIATKYFPNTTNAFNSGKEAAGSFKQIFAKENGKTFMENFGDGMNAAASAIGSAKGAMSEFGDAAGLIIGALDLAVPGLGTALMGLSQVFTALGIDVSGALKMISDAIERLLKGDAKGPMETAFFYFQQWYDELSSKIYQLGYDWEELGLLPKDIFGKALTGAKDYEKFIENLAESLGMTIEQVRGIFTKEQELLIKSIAFAGQYDPETGEKAGVSEEKKQKIMARLAELQASEAELTPEEILDILINEFGKTALKTLGIAQMLGLPPLAKGGLVSGETLALVGDNPMAQIDPEVISPLSKLKAMLVEPTLAAISSMTSQGSTTQIIYVTLDGRVMSEAVFQNLPEVVRMNVGSLA